MIRAVLRSGVLRQRVLSSARRNFASSRAARADESIASVEKVEVVQPRRPIGGFRGGCVLVGRLQPQSSRLLSLMLF